MRRAVLLVAAAVLLGGLAGHAIADSFAMPSGNISCRYQKAGEVAGQGERLFCERLQPLPAYILLGENGRASVERNPLDSTCCSADSVLAYGEAWKRGGFACHASQAGVTCSRANGHGFSLNRSAAKAW